MYTTQAFLVNRVDTSLRSTDSTAPRQTFAFLDLATTQTALYATSAAFVNTKVALGFAPRPTSANTGCLVCDLDRPRQHRSYLSPFRGRFVAQTRHQTQRCCLGRRVSQRDDDHSRGFTQGSGACTDVKYFGADICETRFRARPPFRPNPYERRGSHTRPSSSRPPQGQGPPVHRRAVGTTPASTCVTRDNLISPARVSRTSIRRDALRGRALPCIVIA